MKSTTNNLFISFLVICIFISCNKKKQQEIDKSNTNQTSTYTIDKTLKESEYHIDLLNLKTKNKLGSDTLVTVTNDPVYHKTKRYQAVNALTLITSEIDLSKVDTKDTKIVFECIDGYKPEMPLALFLASKPYLAYKDLDTKGTDWEPISKNGNKMDAAPFYLVYTDAPADDDHYKWPYNLIKIHLEPIDKSKADLYPKEISKVTGYNLFQNQCITCHAINGIGGEMGPELNYPKSVTEYWIENELVDYIVNPASFRNKVKMPTLGITKQQSQEIVEYLKYMAKNKKQN
ncbi:c-type cytochrome [Flavobacterium aestivum]|uniref:c-type cytochrome n=1 Tax=Flavobacterium aestivum TaxID=3003257 RepID=UPI00228567B4|nr:c-type cytochrome [Flavobacterium aestivum]